jgi:hypothetical protein
MCRCEQSVTGESDTIVALALTTVLAALQTKADVGLANRLQNAEDYEDLQKPLRRSKVQHTSGTLHNLVQVTSERNNARYLAKDAISGFVFALSSETKKYILKYYKGFLV